MVDERWAGALFSFSVLGLLALGPCVFADSNETISEPISVEFEYISPKQVSEIEKSFAEAQFAKSDLERIRNKIWNCDLFGVRSKLQVKRDLHLYVFNQKINAEKWTNSGSGPLVDYNFSEQTFQAKNSRIRDVIRLNKKEELISRLETTEDSKILAYALCKPLETKTPEKLGAQVKTASPDQALAE